MSRGASADEQFEKLLSSYRSNYMQYVVTGQPTYKTAYETVYNQLDQLISARQQQVNGEKTAATQYLSNFKQDNQDIQNMRDKVSSMLDDVQTTKQQYEAAKSRYDNTDITSSLSPKNQVGLGIVLRLGILLILIPIFFVLGYFYPSESGKILPRVTELQQQAQLLGTTVGAAASQAFAQSPALQSLSPRTQAFGR